MTTTNIDLPPAKCEPGASEYWPIIPAHLRQGLKAYIDDGRPTGDFLRAVLENNLHRAVLFADPHSLDGLYALCVFLYNCAPMFCWGSPERVATWIRGDQAVSQ